MTRMGEISKLKNTPAASRPTRRPGVSHGLTKGEGEDEGEGIEIGQGREGMDGGEGALPSTG